MRFTRYFALFITFFVVTSCAYNDIDILAPSAPAGSGAVTICGRITSFGDHSVTTRAGKTNEESYSSSMAMAIFPIEGGALGNCISYIHLQGSNVNFTIDRAQLRETYDDIYDDMPFALYLFANMPELPANMDGLSDKGLSTLESFMQLAYQNNGIRRPQKGFPMIGSLGDYITPGADGKRFVLIPTSGEDANLRILLPQVDDEPSDYIPIPLKALYAKFSFIISLEPDQHIQNGATPTFTLENYTLRNVPNVVYADSAKNRETSVLTGEITTSVGTSVTEGGELKFDFYLPERFLTPNTSAEEYGYPLGENYAKVTGYSNVRDEDKKYCQRFKPDLVKDQNATYVTLSGHYSDHQGHSWKVDYDIYLGEDNYGNFDFKRNINYINSVVIRGLSASNDQGQTDYGPFIDHRVTVTRTLPIIINLHRETLLDSHFEVRPLRVRHPSGDHGGATVTVEILDSLGKSVSESDRFPNWVRMELSGNTSSHLASGKRKYFTTDLVSNTLAGNTKITATLNGANQETFWIYVDECTDVGIDYRKAIIKVTYSEDPSSPMKYTICQHKLFPVTYGENTYYIEYEEEYLHNYDSEDSYGNTEFEGMPWGIPNTILSNEKQAILIHNSGMEALTNPIKEALLKFSPLYDFYLERDVDKNIYYFGNGEYDRLVHNHNGFSFCNRIITNIKNTEYKIGTLTLEQEPKSAIEYCYNRNKRDENGNVDLSNNKGWYLPAIDEIEEIVMSQYTDENNTKQYSYGKFTDFQDKFYWSSQPAFYQNIFYVNRTYITPGDRMGHYMTDNPNFARATRVNFKGGDASNPENYEKVSSGMVTKSYHTYLHFTTDVDWLGGTTLNTPTEYDVTELVKNNGNIGGGTANGEYFIFKWGNNSTNLQRNQTEYVYPPKYEAGYLHRENHKARVRCVRKK